MRNLTLVLFFALGCAEPVPPPPGATLAPQAAAPAPAPAPAAQPAVDSALTEVALAAALDDPNAQYNLASRFFGGEGVPVDYAAAAYLWTQVAETTGDASAQSNAGFVLLFADGIEPQLERAVELLLSAAGGGHVEAPVHLGRAYLEGLGVVRDPVEAWAWAEVARRRALTEGGRLGESVSANAAELQSAAAVDMNATQLQQAKELAEQRQPSP